MNAILYLGCPPNERADTEKRLGAASVGIVWADSAASLLNELERRDLPVLLDLSHGELALQTARDIRYRRASTLMFAVVDAQRPDLTTEAVLAGMADVFARPLGGHRVASAIARERSYEARTAIETEAGDALYAHSSAMRDVLARIARAPSSRAGVVIRGEEGTGRQVVARAIHQTQMPRRGPFVRVDCAMFDGDQVDVELFGQAARSSHSDHAGRGLERVARQSRLFEAANGTLY